MKSSSCLEAGSLAFLGLGPRFLAGCFFSTSLLGLDAAFGFAAVGIEAASFGLILAGLCISYAVGAAPVSFTFMTNSTSALGK